MRILFLCAATVSATLVSAQPPTSLSFLNQQKTTDVVGITSGQTAKLTVLYPTAPAPILQILCSATLAIFDDQAKVLKSDSVAQLVAGRSFSIDVNADAGLSGAARTEIHGISIAPLGC